MGLREVGERLLERWQNVSTRGKIFAVITGILLLAALFYLGTWLGKTEMAPLFTNLDEKDAAAVVEELKSSNVKYELVDQGKTVTVPADQVYDLRLQLASSNVIASGGAGFELFDQTKLGITDFERNLNYQRALQEELRRTIIQLDEVEQARIHLVMPEESAFVEDEVPPSASVALKLNPGKELDSEQVRGIVLLITGSVQGLKAENVTVIDMAGNVLSDDLSEEASVAMGGLSLKNHRLKEGFQNQLEAQMQAILDKIFGAGKAVAVVNADLDFSQHEQRTVTYGNQVVRSESGASTTENAAAAGTVGVAGVDSNVPNNDAIDTTTTQSQTGTGANGSEEYTRNYEIDSTEDKIIFAPGEVQKLSVAIVVDGTLTPERTIEVQNLMTAAVGLDIARGDLITVSSMDFDTTLADQIQKSLEEPQVVQTGNFLMDNIKWIAGGILGLLILLVLIGVMIRMRRAKKGSALDMVIEEPIPVSQFAEETPAMSPEAIIRKEQKEKARKFVEEQTEEAANILKTWLSYDE